MKFLAFHSEEDGTATTEFVMFLPVWIVMFSAIMGLGRVGMTSSAVELTAQKALWAEVIPISESDDVDAVHSSARAAAVKELAYFDDVVVANNPMEIVDGAELIGRGAGLEIGGHWGESSWRLVAFQLAFSEIDLDTPNTVLGEAGRFPHLLLNDTLIQDWGGMSGVEGVVANFVAASGYVPGLLAGIRYGGIYASASRTGTSLVGSHTAEAHYDTIVAPSPITGGAGELRTWGGAFLLAQTIDEYQTMQRWGKSEWDRGNENTQDSGTDVDTGPSDDEIDEACDAVPVGSSCSSNSDCTDAGVCVGTQSTSGDPPVTTTTFACQESSQC